MARSSSWGFPAASASGCSSGYRPASTVAADSRAVSVYRWPYIWTPVCSRSLRPLPACSCPDCASPVSHPRRGYGTQPAACFLAGVCQRFGSVGMTVPTAVHMCWTYHSACLSHRFDARSAEEHLAEFSLSGGKRVVVSTAIRPSPYRPRRCR